MVKEANEKYRDLSDFEQQLLIAFETGKTILYKDPDGKGSTEPVIIYEDPIPPLRRGFSVHMVGADNPNLYFTTPDPKNTLTGLPPVAKSSQIAA